MIHHSRLPTSCKWFNIFSKLKVIVLRNDFHEVMISLVLWIVKICGVTNHSVSKSQTIDIISLIVSIDTSFDFANVHFLEVNNS